MASPPSPPLLSGRSPSPALSEKSRQSYLSYCNEAGSVFPNAPDAAKNSDIMQQFDAPLPPLSPLGRSSPSAIPPSSPSFVRSSEDSNVETQNISSRDRNVFAASDGGSYQLDGSAIPVTPSTPFSGHNPHSAVNGGKYFFPENYAAHNVSSSVPAASFGGSNPEMPSSMQLPPTPPSFNGWPVKLYETLQLGIGCEWNKVGNEFKITDPETFVPHISPDSKSSVKVRLESFKKQTRHYNFQPIGHGKLTYQHETFHRDHPEKSKKIKPKQRNQPKSKEVMKSTRSDERASLSSSERMHLDPHQPCSHRSQHATQRYSATHG